MVDDAARIDGYAGALLDVASAEGDREGITDELQRIAAAFRQSEDLRVTLSDPLVPFERKQGVISDLIGSRASGVTVSLVNLLVGAGRIRDLEAIAARMGELSAEAEEATVAEVRTAIEIDDATIARLTDKLSAATGKRVKTRVIVDPNVVGGVVAKVGDTVFDGSVASRLQELREAWG